MRQAHGVYNGFAPAEGPKALPFELDFSELSTYTFDLLAEETTGKFQFAQGAYVDNSRNPNDVTILVAVTGQRLVVPGRAQITAPIFSIDQTQFTVTTTPGPGVAVQIILLNVPTAYNSWGPITVNVPAIDVNSAPYPAAISGGVFYNTAVTNVTVLPVFAANPARRGLMIQADPGNSEAVQIRFAGLRLWLLPGERYQSDAMVPTEAVSVTGLSTNPQAVSAAQFV